MRGSIKTRLTGNAIVVLFSLLLFAGIAFSDETAEVYVQLGHVFTANAVSFSPDGRHAVSGGDDQTLKLWDIATGTEIRTFTGHASLVSSAVFSPDGRSILSGSWDQTLILWEADTGRTIRSFKGHSGSVSSVAFSPNGRYALSGSYDKSLVLWDVDTGRELKTLTGHSGYVTSVTFSPDGRSALSGSHDKTLILWNIETGEEVRVFSGHSGIVTSVSFSPDGVYAASASGDNTLKLWDIKAGREVRTYKEHAHSITSVSFSHDGIHILSGSEDGSVVLWDVKAGTRVKTYKGHSGWLKSVSFSPDGRYALSGGNDLKLWDVFSGREMKTFTGQTRHTDAAEIFPNGRAVVSGNVDNIYKILDVATGRDTATMVSFSNGEWVIITPDGYFDSSAGGAKQLRIPIGNSTYGLDQFSARFYRPDMVQFALTGKELPEAEEDFVQIASHKPAPFVDIASPKSGTSSEKTSISISAKITDNRGGIGNVHAYLNGALVVNERKTRAMSGEHMVTFRIPIMKGENTISVIAFNRDGTMASTPASITVTSGAAMSEPAIHALVVGINRYGNEYLSMKYAVSDAASFADALKNSAGPLFSKVNIKILTSFEETSKETVKKAFEHIKNVIKPHDIFVFYMASHGLIDVVDDEEQYYFLTSNVHFLSSHQIGKQALSQEEMLFLIGNIPAQKKFIILDTCHAGHGANEISFEKLKRHRGLTESTAVKLLQRILGNTVFSSLSDIRMASEGYREHGLFTYILNEGLKGKAVVEKDKIITVHSLAEYMQMELGRLSEEIFKKEYAPITQTGANFAVGKIK
jgi:WD40 repeat protein